MQRPVVSSAPALPSHLQEAEKQNRGLQQELAALREELRTREPGGGWPSACLPWSRSPTPDAQLPRGSHTASQGCGDESLFQTTTYPTTC